MNKNIKFEDAMEKLETITAKLEGASLSLDESLAAFEEAVSLIKVCNDKLSDAEQKVRVLIEGADGAVTDAPFDTVGDET